jgi:hypothetical protein
VLISHCVALTNRIKMENMCGVFSTNLNFEEIACLAGDHAHQVCHEEIGECPSIDICATNVLPTFNIPAHVEYVLFELLKNGMRATVEHSRKTGSSMSAILIKCSSDEKVCILI